MQILWPSVFRFLLMYFSIWVYHFTVANGMPLTKADRITIDRKTWFILLECPLLEIVIKVWTLLVLTDLTLVMKPSPNYC